MSAIDVCRSLARRSSATLTIVVSRIDMIDPTITIAAMRHTQGSMRSPAAGVGEAGFIRIRKVRCLTLAEGAALCRQRYAGLARNWHGVPGDGARTARHRWPAWVSDLVVDSRHPGRASPARLH